MANLVKKSKHLIVEKDSAGEMKPASFPVGYSLFSPKNSSYKKALLSSGNIPLKKTNPLQKATLSQKANPSQKSTVWQNASPSQNSAFWQQSHSSQKGNLSQQKLFWMIRLARQRQVDIQTAIAPELRRMAIEHLRNGYSSVAKGFRGEYGLVFPGKKEAYESFLQAQARPGTWATDIELQALGALFAVNVVVTSHQPGRESQEFVLYEASIDAPTVHLHNHNNVHWSCPGEETKGDGNCLYNAFVQNLANFFEDSIRAKFQEKSLLQQQKIHYGELLHKAPDEATLQQQLASEQLRLEKIRLNDPEQYQQIIQDYQLALKLAAEEVRAKASIPVVDNRSHAIRRSK